MSSSNNIELARSSYEAFARGDLQAVLDMCDPEIELRDPVEGATYRGRDGLIRFLQDWLEPWEEARLEAEEFVEVGDKVVVMVRWLGRGRESGVEAEMRAAHVWTVEDARAVRFDAYLDRAEALDSVGLRTKPA